jgi:hypothetical protein
MFSLVLVVEVHKGSWDFILFSRKDPASIGAWLAQELSRCDFADSLLARWFSLLIERLSDGLGRSIPLAFGDWAATKSAYRFLDNDRVSEAEILAGHFEATRDRFAATHGPILVLHDTTEFSFIRNDTKAIGQTHRVGRGHKDKTDRQPMHIVCGILMYSSLAVTTQGLPLGLAAIKLWTRKKFKGTNALKGKGVEGGSIRSTSNAFRLSKKKVFVGWKMFVNPLRISAMPHVAFTLTTAKATSTNCSVSVNPWVRSSCSAPALIAGPNGARRL